MAGRIKSFEAVRADLAERQSRVDSEMSRLLEQVSLEEESPAKDPRQWFPPQTQE